VPTLPSDPSPTRQFLLHCLRSYLAADFSALPPLETVDWEALPPLAEFHRVGPLFERALLADRAPSLPAPVKAQLAANVRANSNRNLFLTAELARLLKHLQAQNVDVIPFKGPLLSLWLYHDPALRHYSDLDILVRQSDVPVARAVIHALGYQPSEAHSYHDSFRLERGPLTFRLELHWHLMILPELYPFTPDFEQVWERCAPLPFAGQTTLALAPEDLLLFLCAHGSRHLWFRLQWVCDVAQLLQRAPQLDWDSLFDRARQAGGLRMVSFGLLLARDLLGAPLPPEIEPRLRRDRTIMRLVRQVERQYFSGPLAVLKPWKEIFFPLLLIDRLPDRLTYLPRLWLKKGTFRSKG
jgi:hypothetical protein